jgi:hypothetical protein
MFSIHFKLFNEGNIKWKYLSKIKESSFLYFPVLNFKENEIQMCSIYIE